MARGIRPVAGIAEAKRMAAAWGFSLIEISMVAPVPFDFGIHSSGSTSLVRVRRLRNHGYRVELICRSCAGQIREFRELVLPEGIGRELWVRGPERAWHRYRIFKETIEEIGDVVHPGVLTGGTGTEEEPGLPGEVQPG